MEVDNVAVVGWYLEKHDAPLLFWWLLCDTQQPAENSKKSWKKKRLHQYDCVRYVVRSQKYNEALDQLL